MCCLNRHSGVFFVLVKMIFVLFQHVFADNTRVKSHCSVISFTEVGCYFCCQNGALFMRQILEICCNVHSPPPPPPHTSTPAPNQPTKINNKNPQQKTTANTKQTNQRQNNTLFSRHCCLYFYNIPLCFVASESKLHVLSSCFSLRHDLFLL